MRVKVLARRVPNIGRQGEVRELDPKSARVLIALGKVEEIQTEALEDKPKPEREESKPKESKAKKKTTGAKTQQTYKTRQLKAESSAAKGGKGKRKK